jgi:hypothetical protein|uniref:Uncharacterized protein n=1 Tax=viral metagenome TaxID=1070528 RepID=A0A6C0LZU3_9ZZZZ
MWVLLGISDDTVEKETFVYFIGVFDDLSLVKQKVENLITTTNSKRGDYIIKSLTINNTYNYDWSHNEEDEIKSI